MVAKRTDSPPFPSPPGRARWADEDDDDWSAERERQADARKLLARLEDWLRHEGLSLPRRQHRGLSAVVFVLRRMGGKLEAALEFDGSIRELGELAALDERTVMRA